MNKPSLTRRILAVMWGTVGIAVLAYMSVVLLSEVALGALIATVVSVTAFYFGTKTS